MSNGPLVTGTIRLPENVSNETDFVSSVFQSVANDLGLPEAFRHVSSAAGDDKVVTGSIRVPHGKEDDAAQAVSQRLDQLAASLQADDSLRRVIVEGRASNGQAVVEGELTIAELGSLSGSRGKIVRVPPNPGFGVKF